MKKVRFFKPLLLLTTIALAFNSCQDDDEAIQRISKTEVIQNYAEIVHANYVQ